MLYTLSGVPAEAFAGFPMPRNTAVFAPTFAGEGTVRLDDVTADPRYGHKPPHHGMPEGHLPVRSYLAVPVRSARGRGARRALLRAPGAGPLHRASTSGSPRGSPPTPPSPSTTPASTRPSASPARWRSGPSAGWRCWPTPAGCWRRRSTSTSILERAGPASWRPTMADGCVVFLAGDDGLLRPVVAARPSAGSPRRTSRSQPSYAPARSPAASARAEHPARHGPGRPRLRPRRERPWPAGGRGRLGDRRAAGRPGRAAGGAGAEHDRCVRAGC